MSRKLDALFAERVLGWNRIRNDDDHPFGPETPSFTTSLDAAWQGVEKAETTIDDRPVILKFRQVGGEWSLFWGFDKNEEFIWVHGCSTPALALTKALLLAAGVSEEEIREAENA